jgi:pimeloyl-ACP methyl ester carboxylesterase
MHGHGDVDAILRSVKDNWGEELRAAVLDRSFHEPLGDEARAGFLGWAAGAGQQATYDVLASQRDLDLTGELAGIRQPAIVVHGRYDRARLPEQGRELAGALPNAEFRLVETGHTPLYEAPAAIAAAARDVLARAR